MCPCHDLPLELSSHLSKEHAADLESMKAENLASHAWHQTAHKRLMICKQGAPPLPRIPGCCFFADIVRAAAHQVASQLATAVLQGVPIRDQDHGVYCAQAERCALHSALAGCAPELWHERDPAPHEEPPIPHQLHEVGSPAWDPPRRRPGCAVMSGLAVDSRTSLIATSWAIYDRDRSSILVVA